MAANLICKRQWPGATNRSGPCSLRQLRCLGNGGPLVLRPALHGALRKLVDDFEKPASAPKRREPRFEFARGFVRQYVERFLRENVPGGRAKWTCG